MIKTLRNPVIRVGPDDHGRRMSLDDFDRAIGREGYLYELNKGVIDVVDVPEPSHGRQFQELRDQLVGYRLSHPGVVTFIGGGAEAKLLIGPPQSERHPDIVVYTSAPPEVEDVWSTWVPEIVVEIVSARSAKRDYVDKPPEYLAFGVDEYWIVDAAKLQMTALTRWRGQWNEQIIKPGKKYKTRRLPGFALDLRRVFAVLR